MLVQRWTAQGRDGKRVQAEIYGTDQDRRLLGARFIDGPNINLAMIEAGLAEVYCGPESGNPYQPQYQAAEAAARVARKGMWVLGEQYEIPRADGQCIGIREPGSHPSGMMEGDAGRLCQVLLTKPWPSRRPSAPVYRAVTTRNRDWRGRSPPVRTRSRGVVQSR